MRRSDFLRTMLAVVSVPPAAALAWAKLGGAGLAAEAARRQAPLGETTRRYRERYGGSDRHIIIRIDGIDPRNPRHQALIREAVETLRRRIGA